MRWHPEVVLAGTGPAACGSANDRYLRHARGLIPVRGYATRSAARKGADRALAAADRWFMESVGGVPPVARAILAAVGSAAKPRLRFRRCSSGGT